MSRQEQQPKEDAIINIRKLVALDIVFHGATFILAEFAFAVVFCGVAGIFSLFLFFRTPSHPAIELIMGVILAWLTLNYAPLLVYAINMRHKNVQQEVAYELEHKATYARKYTLQSVLLLLPLVVPFLVIIQERQKHLWSNQ